MTSALSMVPPGPASSSSGPAPAALPCFILDGRYDVLRPIAQGGMGQVFEARHNFSGKLVVVKILRDELVGRKDVAERLRREAEAMARIPHPAILSLLDAGRCAIHGPFLVTELLDGRTLEGILASRTALSVPAVARLLREVGAALGAAHRQDVVHRDVKSANLFIARKARGEGDVVKVIDFGVARVGGSAGSTPLTLVGGVLGSLSTMSPEQLVSPSTVDGRADLYSLGITALEALGLEVGDLTVRLSTPRIAAGLLRGRDDMPADLVTLLDDLCALDPQQRPRTAEVMLERLARVQLPRGSDELLGYGAEPTIEVQAERSWVGVRRRHSRAPYVTPVELVHRNGVILGRSEDISLGGMLVSTQRPPPEDASVTLRFALPSTGQKVAIDGHIRWARQQAGRSALGIEFGDLDDVAAETVASFVEG